MPAGSHRSRISRSVVVLPALGPEEDRFSGQERSCALGRPMQQGRAQPTIIVQGHERLAGCLSQGQNSGEGVRALTEALARQLGALAEHRSWKAWLPS
eukprot:9284669-Alexandrium_andersonii.AAC.1